MNSENESISFDVLIVGAGPAGLSAAIRLKQQAKKLQMNLSVCVLEKASEVGGHIISGAIIESRVLSELFPDWENLGAPLYTKVAQEFFLFLTQASYFKLPIPTQFSNNGNYIISLGKLCRWLALQAESLGVEIFPGFPAAKLLYSSDGSVKGVVTADMGLDKKNNQTDHYQQGIEIYAKQVIFAEGCRGSLSKQIINKYKLDNQSEDQVYGLGLKELWEVQESNFEEGEIFHTVGWPLPADVYGGSFLYQLENNIISIGLVVGLDYKNTWLSPYDLFQQFKSHPYIQKIIKGGKRISYGARTLSEGGFQSLPKLTFPGGMLIGDSAGFLNVPKLKGTHMAMQSGVVAADALIQHFKGNVNLANKEVIGYGKQIKENWMWDELYRARNIKPAFSLGLKTGLLYSAFDSYVLRGMGVWTLKHKHVYLQRKGKTKKSISPEYDGIITFERLSSVYLSNIHHIEDQPCHLQLKDATKAISINYKQYASPEERYCPAGVYKIVKQPNAEVRLQIDAQNCLHCKACDIKDPSQNINWVVPEGGSGPNYAMM